MRRILVVLLCVLSTAATLLAADTAALANNDSTYLALRKLALGSEAVAVKDLRLKRDAGVFDFKSGAFYFAAPVNGKVTAAIFIGEGEFSLNPPIAIEKRTLRLLTKQGGGMEEKFDQLVLRFTDSTYDEIKKASTGAAPANGQASELLSENHNQLRNNLHFNLPARVLQDVLSEQPGGLFIAFIKGKTYSNKMLYVVDPHGVPEFQPDYALFPRVAPEEVALATWDSERFGVWAAFHLSPEYAKGTATGSQWNTVLHIEKQQLDTTIEKSGKISGVASTTFVSTVDELRVVPFNLFPSLRVSAVTDAAGTALPFIQEEKKDDPQFSVILPKSLAKGEKFTVKTTYSGKDAVIAEGGGNFFPVAREDWYPNTSFGDYEQYEMTFRVPRNVKVVATGNLVKESKDGDLNVSEWRTEVPQAVAGFNVGSFKAQQVKAGKDFVVESYANDTQPDILRNVGNNGAIETMIGRPIIEDRAVGTLSTTDLSKKALAEGQIAVQLYTDYFGEPSYKRLAMTQQTAFGFGQSWPGLVYLPILSYLDQQARHDLGVPPTVESFFKAVAPHEVAHQWWGHTVGFNSYRDQWISEGFSETSASLFLQFVYKDKPNAYLNFWKEERDLLLDKDPVHGFRGIDLPVTQGYRLMTGKTGNIPRRLIYPKGGYILHMLRMMMWTPKEGDAQFKKMMKDFVQTYRNRPATTEDFKALVEKYVTPSFNLTGDGKMDWFFDEYVYGTALPKYAFDYNLDGGTLKMKITQSNVDDTFKMIVPIYAEMENGKIARLGTLAMAGNSTQEQQVPLGNVKPKRLMLNYNYDVLCDRDK